MIPLSQKGALHMLRVPRALHHLVQLTCTLLTLLVDGARFLWLCLHAPTALAAENLFLRKQLALYQERQIEAQRAPDARPPRAGLAGALVRLASGISHCTTGDLYPLASAGIPAVLALEVEAWTPADPSGPASPHPPDGAGEPLVG